MYIDGYPSIELEPKITLATDNCEKHGRIHFVSGNYFAKLPLHYLVVILRGGFLGVPYFLCTVFPVTSVTSPDYFFLGYLVLGSLVLSSFLVWWVIKMGNKLLLIINPFKFGVNGTTGQNVQQRVKLERELEQETVMEIIVVLAKIQDRIKIIRNFRTFQWLKKLLHEFS